MRDIPKAILVFGVIVVIGLSIGIRCAEAARPDNGWFPSGAVAYIGLDNDLVIGGGSSPFCRDDANQVGRFGTRVPLWRSDRHAFVVVADHQSCLQEEHDEASAEWLGIRYEIGFW